MQRGVLAGAMTAWALLVGQGTARADAGDRVTSSARPRRPLELGVGVFYGMAFGEVCERESDVEGCTTATVSSGVSIAPRWRALPELSVGVVGSVPLPSIGSDGTQSSDGSHTDTGLRLYRLLAGVRFHPLGALDTDPWIGGAFGVSALKDFADVYGPNGVHVANHSAMQAAPSGELGAGVDFLVTSYLSLSLELRASVAPYGHSNQILVAEQDRAVHDVGTLTAVNLGFGGVFLASP